MDLILVVKQLFVKVPTAQDVPNKDKTMLENSNLITTNDIIYKAQNDAGSLNELYDVLKLEFERLKKHRKPKKAVQFSRCVGLKNIAGLNSNEYEIDRSRLVNLPKIYRNNDEIKNDQE